MSRKKKSEESIFDKPLLLDDLLKTKVCVNCKLEKDVSEFGTRKKNHDGKRGRCKECEKIDRAEYLSTEKGEAKRKECSKKWYAENREYSLQRQKQWCEENKEHRLKYSRTYNIKKYGLTDEQYENMLIKQNHKCKICGSDRPNKRSHRFFIDHCH